MILYKKMLSTTTSDTSSERSYCDRRYCNPVCGFAIGGILGVIGIICVLIIALV